MSGCRERRGAGRVFALVGAGLVMVVCCAGPLLVAGGALGVVGGVLRNWWLTAVGAMIACGAVAYVLRCRGGAGPEDCCPSVPGLSGAVDQGKPPDEGGADVRGRRGVP